MATVKISELVRLIGPPDSDDFIPIVDRSATQTKRILISDLLSGDSALNATNAIYARYADSATDATFAIVANRALEADSAVNATNAIVAQRALGTDSAINATNAIVANRAFAADSALNASFALTADHALTADSCLRATTALVADRTLVDSTAFATQAIRALRADSAFVAYTAVRAARLDYEAGPIWGADSTISSGDSALDILRTDLNAVTVGDSASIISLLSTGVQSILPAADSTYDLGSPTRKWKDLWLSGATIHLGDSAILSAKGQTITIPNLVVTGTSTGAGVDSAYVLAQINGLIDGAPGALNTLNEIAAALNDDDSAYGTLINLIGAKDSDFVKSAANQAWIQSNQTPQDFAYSSLTGAPTVLDSANVITLIGANETPQDFSYSSLTGTPTVLDSANVITLIGANETPQDFAYSSLTGTPTIPTFGNDYVDSGAVITLIGANETPQDFSYSSLTGTPTVLDSAAILAIPGVGGGGTDSAAVVSLIEAHEFDAIKESFTTDAGSSTVSIDLNTNSTVLATGLASNFGLVLTNVPTTGKTTIGTAVIIDQTNPSWTADSATINGASTPIRWLGGAQPLGNDSCTEIFNFTIINDSGTYTLLGSATDYK